MKSLTLILCILIGAQANAYTARKTKLGPKNKDEPFIQSVIQIGKDKVQVTLTACNTEIVFEGDVDEMDTDSFRKYVVDLIVGVCK